ncbi:MAG TPA: CoA pyrophosphatase [bacterium]|nr:CoA pyrophosphatase [bacterium]
MKDFEMSVRGRLAAGKRREAPDSPGRRAAVLVPLYDTEEGPYVLFTKRTDAVEHHKGQISFPGGAADPDDPDALSTALRETHEELGIAPHDVKVLGALDDVPTVVSGFVITPFVGIIPHPYPLRVNPVEIAEVLFVPLSIFRDADKMRVEERDREGERVTVYFYYYGPHEIWGATARIMKGFIDTVFGDSA